MAETFNGVMAGRDAPTRRAPVSNAGRGTAVFAATGLVALAALLPVLLLTWNGGLSEAEQRYNAGVELQMQGLLEEAVAAYDEVVREDSELTVAYYNRANAYASLERYEPAIQDYDASIQLSPRCAQAHANRGIAYFHLGDRERAVEDYTKAVRLDPELVRVYNNRGIAYERWGEYEQARRGRPSRCGWLVSTLAPRGRRQSARHSSVSNISLLDKLRMGGSRRGADRRDAATGVVHRSGECRQCHFCASDAYDEPSTNRSARFHALRTNPCSWR